MQAELSPGVEIKILKLDKLQLIIAFLSQRVTLHACMDPAHTHAALFQIRNPQQAFGEKGYQSEMGLKCT